MIRLSKLSLPIGALLWVSGCATVPRDAGFSSVQQTVSDRTAMTIRWNRTGDDAKQIDSEVKALLAKPLTPASAAHIALLNNESLQATYEELGIAQADVVRAALPQNPSITGEVRFPKYHSLPFEVDITQSFLDLILLPVKKRAAEAAFAGTKARVTNEILATVAEAKADLYRVQGAEQLVEMRRAVVTATDASFEAAKRLHDAGNIPDLRFAQERALAEQAKVDLARAEADVQDAREELNAVLGVWGEATTWSVTPRLPELPTTEVNSSGLESLAIRQRGDLAASKNEVEQAAAMFRLSPYSELGDFSVAGHYEKDTDGAGTAGPALTVPLPIFNQGQPAIASAEGRLRQAQHRYEALAVQIRAEVRRTRSKLVAARDRANYYRRVIVPLRHEIVSGTQLQFNGMFVGVFELLQAKQEEINAGSEYVEALTEYWTTRAELERLVGGKFPGEPPTSDDSATSSPDAPKEPAQLEHHHHGD